MQIVSGHYNPKWVRLNYATTHHHPPPAKIYPPPSTATHHQPKYIHHHQPPPTTSENISNNTHHHPPSSKVYPQSPTTIQSISTTTHHHPKHIHHHSAPPSDSQNFFYKKLIYKNLFPRTDGNVRNLNRRPAIAKKLSFTRPSPLILLHTPEMVFKSCNVNELYTVRNYFSFEKRQVFKWWKYSGVKNWKSHFKEIIEFRPLETGGGIFVKFYFLWIERNSVKVKNSPTLQN